MRDFIGMLGMGIRIIGGFAVTGMFFYAIYIALNESLKAGGIIFLWAIGASWLLVIIAGLCDKFSGMD